MRQRLLSRLTYANVMSTLAVFLVIGGGAAYAANTIGSADVIDESLLSQDLKDGEVTSGDVRNDSSGGGLGAIDLAASSVGTSEISTSAIQTADIGFGQVRAGDLGTLNRRAGTTTTINADAVVDATASCLAGERALSGGYLVSNGTVRDMLVIGQISVGSLNPTGWVVKAANIDVNNNNAGTITVTPYAICVAA